MIIMYCQLYQPHRLFPIMHLALVFPLGLYLPIHLYILAILICRLVDLSTCRPSAVVNNKDPVRVRLGLGLVWG